MYAVQRNGRQKRIKGKGAPVTGRFWSTNPVPMGHLSRTKCAEKVGYEKLSCEIMNSGAVR